jgi:hypothetical protein
VSWLETIFTLTPAFLDLYGLDGHASVVCCFKPDGKTPTLSLILYVDTEMVIPEDFTTTEERKDLVRDLKLEEPP